VPIAAIVTASIILSVSFFAFSGLMSNMSVPVIPLVNVGSSTNPTLLWNYTTGNLVYSSPTVVNGEVYVGSLDGNIYALNATNGAKIWNYTTSGQVFPSPAVVDGVVYDGSALLPPPGIETPTSVSIPTCAVYALNATNGIQLWKYNTGSFGVSSCPDVIGGVVYVGSWDDNVYALNATSGAKLWNYTTGGPVYSSAVAGGVIYVDSSNNNIYALNATNGDRIWNCTTGPALIGSGVPYPILSSSAIVGGVVYVGSDNGTVYALNAESGTFLWNYTIYVEGGFSWINGGMVPVMVPAVLSSPFVFDGVLYVGSTDGNIEALNASNGEKIWNWTISGSGESFNASPAVVNGVIYVANDGNFYALNATDGDQLWNFTTSYYQNTSPTFFNGVVYAGGDNNVYALRVASPTPSPTLTSSTVISNTQLIIIGESVAVIIIASIVILLLRKKPKSRAHTQVTFERAKSDIFGFKANKVAV
jgi:outer membrane protein assembly factor BamB